ncbi:helix-turn-helix transcriptional regulator [Methylobacterium sp. PvR107]|uniref:helix-turn-helix transcriptional regulator n=1 Tax=Methylobacterium sp. PvR107 TaxID=2806597 RepID=UPI001B72DBF0|nr:helix-turn-helix transcriptional regulator [Methylobacterium sp. PvR107]MBP1184026.1 DNA-binding CsgD family transcriptional regulator [Methylobacterium sp. PvR107]
MRAWRLIAGGSDRTAFDPGLVETALQLLIEHFEQGLAVTDRCGRVQFLNRAARAYLGRGLLRLEQGCLRGTKPADAAALRRIVADAAAGHGGSARLEGEGAPLLVAACAILPSAGAVPGGAVLLRLVDPAAARLPTAAMLQEQFGFTPAEAALAGDILAGNDLAASAARRRITRNTARVHLRHLFEKTGTRRQAELMRLLLLCPQPIAAAQSGGTEISAPGPLSRSNGGCGYKTI